MPRKRSEQSTIPGMEPKRIKQVHLAGLAYIEARDSRMAATSIEVDSKAALIAAMQKHKVEAYLDDELSVDLTTPDVKVKARLLTDEEEEE